MSAGQLSGTTSNNTFSLISVVEVVDLQSGGAQAAAGAPVVVAGVGAGAGDASQDVKGEMRRPIK